jgi:transcriptional regulator with XRE-family HTH domain
MRTPEQVFGTTIRELRLERGWTQEQLAERAYLHRTYVAAIEAGKRNVAIVNVVYLARAIGVAPGELFRNFTKPYIDRQPPNDRNATRMSRNKRGNRTQEVVGSIPFSSTNGFAPRRRVCFVVTRRIRST